jgi:hypothetical protein
MLEAGTHSFYDKGEKRYKHRHVTPGNIILTHLVYYTGTTFPTTAESCIIS